MWLMGGVLGEKTRDERYKKEMELFPPSLHHRVIRGQHQAQCSNHLGIKDTLAKTLDTVRVAKGW